MDMDLNNRLTEDETLEQAYDIFLELAADNLDPADVLLFNLQFEERGGAELFDPAEDWQEHVDFTIFTVRQTNHHFGKKVRVQIEINMFLPVFRRIE